MKKLIKNLWQDESGQGATEYILLLVIVVAVALLFRGRITELVTEQIQKVSDGMGSLTVK